MAQAGASSMIVLPEKEKKKSLLSDSDKSSEKSWSEKYAVLQEKFSNSNSLSKLRKAINLPTKVHDLPDYIEQAPTVDHALVN
jgi:hypothetical protein